MTGEARQLMGREQKDLESYGGARCRELGESRGTWDRGIFFPNKPSPARVPQIFPVFSTLETMAAVHIKNKSPRYLQLPSGHTPHFF